MEAGVSFIVVGGAAGVILGAPIVTLDLDIVHHKAPENIDRLLAWLIENGAHHRFDLANRRLPPTREQLAGNGHLNRQLDSRNEVVADSHRHHSTGSIHKNDKNV